MTHIDEEIASQPDCWQRAAGRAASVAELLPRRGERVAVAGCGTSWFVGTAYAALRESGGHGETDAFAASEMPAGRRYDRVVLITRSGTTTEVVDLLGTLPADVPAIAVTADPAAPVAQLASAAVTLDFADERSVVQTRFATTALALLRAHLGADLSGAVDDARNALAAPLPVDPATVEQLTFLGLGWTVGLAHEAALKLREAATFWAESYPAMEYRHGPMSVTGPGRAVWLLGGPQPEGLAADVARTGGAFVHSADLDPMADLVRVQRLAAALARHRGLDPDRPRHLARSVILR